MKEKSPFSYEDESSPIKVIPDMVPCEVCGKPSPTETKKCDDCLVVESMLPNYICHPKGQQYIGNLLSQIRDVTLMTWMKNGMPGLIPEARNLQTTNIANLYLLSHVQEDKQREFIKDVDGCSYSVFLNLVKDSIKK
jgi:hypothetical protein